MKWAIVMYAVFVLDGEPVEKISWGLTFDHHEKCMTFFEQNKNRVIEGLGDFAESNGLAGAELQEIGCAHATADFEGETDTADVTLRMPLWIGEQI